jgi:hypothetical protein
MAASSCAAGDLHDVGVRGPVGRRQDHLVARIQTGHQRIEDDLLGARAHADFIQRKVQSVVALELELHRGLHGRAAVEHGVARVAALHGTGRGGANVFGRVEVRLARAQHDHRPAGALQRIGMVGNAQDFRHADGANALRGLERGSSRTRKRGIENGGRHFA